MVDGIMGMDRADLIPWPGLNPRAHFDQEALEELRASLKADGMIQPVGVRVNDEPPHWIWAGERRWRAAEGILDRVPVIVRNIDEETALRLALTENMARNDLTAMEEARGMHRYLEASGATQKSLAEELGRNPSWVSNRLRLLKLPARIQELVDDGRMNPTQARDFILPFASLRPDLWEAVTDWLSSARWPTTPMDDDTVQGIVRKALIPHSGWTKQGIYGAEPWQEDFGYGIRIEKKVPLDVGVAYKWSGYMEKSVRVFDREWWTEAMQEAQAKMEEDRAKLDARDEEREPSRITWPSDEPLPAEKRPWWMNAVVGRSRGPWDSSVYRRNTTNDPAEPTPWTIGYDLTKVDPSLVQVAFEANGDKQLVFLDRATYTSAAEHEHDRLSAAVKTKIQDAYIEELALREEEFAPLSAYTAEMLALVCHGAHPLQAELVALGYIENEGRIFDRGGSSVIDQVRAWELDPLAIQKIVRLMLHRMSAGEEPFLLRELVTETRRKLYEELVAHVRTTWPGILEALEGDDDGNV